MPFVFGIIKNAGTVVTLNEEMKRIRGVVRGPKGLDMKPEWLENAVFYEIYPQSFYDSNGDGIGDLEGIIRKMPYIKSLNVNAVWLNPIFDSPFEDAGYDIRDYYKVAERYGTNEDFARLCRVAKENGIRILCDLVPCHTSVEHEMFKKSMSGVDNEYSKRFIWCSDEKYESEKLHHIEGGRKDRYYASYYECQPALNYGFANPTEPWMSSVDAPECRENLKMLCDIMDYWIGLGCSGFRVDMAGELVKNDDGYTETVKVWQKVRKYFDEHHPDCILIPEWNRPFKSIDAGFHMDMNLWGGTLFRVEENTDKKSYFRKEGEGIFSRFAGDYPEILDYIKGRGYYSFVTGNHDNVRISYRRTLDEIKCVFAFIFTMPGAPVLYAGDEIGMKFLKGVETEGSQGRGGSRTPIQWEKGRKNFGFSESDTPYLPCDPDSDAPSIDVQEKDEFSLLNITRKLIGIRREHKALGGDGTWELVDEKMNYPLWYRRSLDGETFYVLINPTSKEYVIDGVDTVELPVVVDKVEIKDKIIVHPFGIIVYKGK